jgi:hypothetical protein
MPASSQRLALATSPTERDEAIAEIRQLTVDLRDAANDGRRLAERYAELLKQVVGEYCNEFELRAEAALARLEGAR